MCFISTKEDLLLERSGTHSLFTIVLVSLSQNTGTVYLPLRRHRHTMVRVMQQTMRASSDNLDTVKPTRGEGPSALCIAAMPWQGLTEGVIASFVQVADKLRAYVGIRDAVLRWEAAHACDSLQVLWPVMDEFSGLRTDGP